MLIKIIFFCVTLSVAYAGLAIMNLEPKPEKFKNEDGCYVSKLDRVIKRDQLIPSPDSCLGYRCYPKHVRIETCGVAIAYPPMKVVSDETKPYPGCCPKIVDPKKPNKL